MMLKISATAGLFLAFALATAACNTQPPKQAEAPDALSDKGADMATGDDARNGNVNANDKGAAEGAEKLHAKCCVSCKEGLAKDRSGGAANTIPCSDFTAELDMVCLEHFRGKKTMASECK
jgi:hypothetical protein